MTLVASQVEILGRTPPASVSDVYRHLKAAGVSETETSNYCHLRLARLVIQQGVNSGRINDSNVLSACEHIHDVFGVDQESLPEIPEDLEEAIV